MKIEEFSASIEVALTDHVKARGATDFRLDNITSQSVGVQKVKELLLVSCAV